MQADLRSLCAPAPGAHPGGPVSSASDEELLQRFAAGQRAAADELLRRHQAAAFRVARRILCNHADAQDAAQEGFAKAFSHLLEFQRRSSFETWLLSIVSRAALNLGRKRERRDRLLQRLHRKQEHDAPDRAADQQTPLQEVLDKEGEERVQTLADTIRRVLMTRATLRMRVVVTKRRDGWSFQKIADDLGCCEKTVRSDLINLRALVLEELAVLGWSIG